MDPILAALQQQAGIHFMGGVNARLQAPGFALDAQPALITQPNAGILSLFSTFIDPKLIEILVAPNKATQVVGEEVKKGDWTTTTAVFMDVENTGEVSSYGDYNTNGVAGVNVNYPQRQPYHYQVFTEVGELEIARMGLAHVDLVNRKNIASVSTLNKFQNASYFFGVAGLQNYGLLNDPNLLAAISPTNESGNITWATKDALGVLADIAALFSQLQSQANGLIDLSTPMTLAMSPGSEAAGLTKTNNFNVNVMDLIKKNYPNMKVETAPEYATASGNLVQLIVNELEGQRTAITAFTEKMRAHATVISHSSFSQKKSQGTFGTIIFRPFLISQMLGV